MSDDLITWWFIWAIIVWGCYLAFWWEQEGVIIDTNDCKQVIQSEDVIYKRIFTKYTCTYNKRLSDGKILWGKCFNATYNDSGVCMELDTYDKKPEITCPDTENGYLSQTDGVCRCNSWKELNSSTNKCEWRIYR